MFDVIVIGGGIIGGAILRELTKYRIKVCLLEKENDVCMGQSKANSGLVHAGFDAHVGTLKAKFNVLGNAMMPEFAKDLGVKYENNGAIVLAFQDEEIDVLRVLYARGKQNGVEGLKLLSREEVLCLEPNVKDNVKGALYAKSAGIVCPYTLTIACIGNAMDNGATCKLNFDVVSIEKKDGIFIVQASDGQSEKGKLIINCAGLACADIARLVGDDSYSIGGRKGEYILLDKSCVDYVKHTLFRTPSEKGKGVVVTPTVDGNIILGPTSQVVDNGKTDTTATGLKSIQDSVLGMVKDVPFAQTITSFAGVRAYSNRHDFIIEESDVCAGFIHCAGIESPGLTSAPAIAKYVVEELVAKHITLVHNPNFNGKREADCFFANLSLDEKNKYIQKNPSYGNVVCRCENITEGEILRAIHVNPPARDIDGVKRRVRAGMGRCQGGFCQPSVLELLAREQNIPLDSVTKKGKNSNVLTGVQQ